MYDLPLLLLDRKTHDEQTGPIGATDPGTSLMALFNANAKPLLPMKLN
jgi:hypothetical protein